MPRFVLLLLFTLPLRSLLAQDELIYMDNDSLRQLYEKELTVKDMFTPQKLDITEDDLIDALDKLPAFGVYRDTYFVTGIPLNEKINGNTADASFQISIRQRLVKSVLPYNTFLYLTYSQKTFWDIYSESSPFRDTNYNPGLGLGKAIVYKDRIVGGMFLQLMHESNGRDEEFSRSWNYISFSAKYFINLNFNVSGEVWIPYVDGGNNKDLLDYRGLGNISTNFVTNKHKWWFTAKLNPRKGFMNINTELSAGFKVSDSSNQYIFARIYNGYGEGLMDYNQYTFNLRVGICIKPDFFSIY